MSQMRECSIIIMSIMLHELPRKHITITKTETSKQKITQSLKRTAQWRIQKMNVRIFLHRFKKKNNRTKKQKSVYRTMILNLVKGMRTTESPSVNPSEYSPLSLPWCEKKALNVVRCYQAFSRRRQWQPTPALLPGKSHGAW